MPRLLPLRELVEGKKKVKPEKAEYLLLESLIQANLAELFPGLEIVSSHLFRVTRDADIEIQEDEASDLLATIEQEVRRRRFGAVVRLEVAPKTPKRVRKLLQKQLEITENEVYEVDGPLGAGDLMSLTRLDRRELKDPPFSPSVPAVFNLPDTSVFAAIRAGDILLHHPYDSFSPVVEMIERASTDPKTVAIKMTLYRTNAGLGDPPRAHPRGRERQAGRGPRGAEGALRRGEEHRVGQVARAGGRPRGLRRRRPEDPRQDRARRPAREGRDPPLRAPRHRQLQRDDGAHLHGFRAHDLPPGVRRGRDAPLQRADGLRGQDELRAPRDGAEGHAPGRPRVDRERDGARPRRPARRASRRR